MGYPTYGPGWTYGGPYETPIAPAVTKEQELETLKGQAEDLEHALEDIKKRVEELQTETK